MACVSGVAWRIRETSSSTRGRRRASRRRSGTRDAQCHSLASPTLSQPARSALRSYVKTEGFNYVKSQTSEQFDIQETDILEIPDIGPITYTPEYHVHKAFLAAKVKPIIQVEPQPGSCAPVVKWCNSNIVNAGLDKDSITEAIAAVVAAPPPTQWS